MSLVTAPAGDIIEVGCWEGMSTMHIARHFRPEVIHCVDHWLGDLTDPGSTVTAKAAARDVFRDFQENMQAADATNYEVHRRDWRECFPWPYPIRFLFIDAQHTYREVLDNIQQALPSMAPGGVIAGHDADMAEVNRAIREAVPAYEQPEGSHVWIHKVAGAARA